MKFRELHPQKDMLFHLINKLFKTKEKMSLKNMIEIQKNCKWEHTAFRLLRLPLKQGQLSKMLTEWSLHIIKNLTQ